MNRDEIARKFSKVINIDSLENDSDTPDYILGYYLVDCLEAFNQAFKQRREHYSYEGKSDQ